MVLLEDILTQEAIHKLGWMLLHFLWQAAAIALLLAILLRVLRKSTASLRYIIACLTMGLIVLLPVVTIQLVPTSVPHVAARIEPAPVPVILSTEQTEEVPVAEVALFEEPAAPQDAGTDSVAIWRRRIVASLEPALPFIVSGWLLGVFGLSVWHLGGWAQLQRLRRKMVEQVDPSLHTRLRRLSERLGLRRSVQLLESALVQIPTVVGWVRPVILLPASALTGLHTDQLEALLAHELAHIRRYDYLVNMLQTVVEILGFYHPAVWWVSHRIRAERENCCDDLAVSLSGDRVRYARALTSMEEIRTSRAELAVAASGGCLLGRIRRLVGKDSTDSSRTSWVPSAITILLIAIMAIPTTLALTHQRQDQSNTNIETILLEGFRKNREKFERGVLAWTRTTKNDGLPERPDLEQGVFELWWDGNRITTKYVDDRVCRDSRGGPYWIEKQTGGNAYDGRLFSRKPEFGPYENWLEQVVRWQGQGSLDNLILMLKERENVTVNWSTVEVDGNKLFKLFTKNVDETVPDEGAYSVEYYDPSKGYGLVNQEWYTSQDQPRLKHTVKLQQVIPDGWFPVDVDMKLFSTDGKVRVHHHFKLDMKRCSFNDASAIPDGIFDFSATKEHEQLDKILDKLSQGADADGADENVQTVCKSVESYIAAALAGDDEKAAEYAHPNTAVVTQTNDTREILQGQDIRIIGVCMGNWNALAISSVIQGDHGRVGPLVFHVKKMILDQKIHRLIDDIDLETLDTIEQEIKRFLERNPESKTAIFKPQRPTITPALHAGKEEDVPVEDERLREGPLAEASPAGNIPSVPVPAESPAPSAGEKTIIQIDCLVLEVFPDLKMDRETTIVAENVLGEKVTLRGSTSTAEVLLRKAAEATGPIEDESAEDKRQQFEALVDVLASRGFVKILMNPTLEVLDGHTAKIRSTQHIRSTQDSLEDSIQITPHVLEDGYISLQAHVVLDSQAVPQSKEQLRVGPGESRIIGSMKKTGQTTEIGSDVEDAGQPPSEVLVILTPTIVQTTSDPQKKADSADKLKRLGLAVATYAVEHENILPDTLQVLKPYLANEQDLLWAVNNVEYLGQGMSRQRSEPQNTPIAYDKTFLAEAAGTNVLFLDGHVESVTNSRLKELLETEPQLPEQTDREIATLQQRLKMRQDYINADPTIKALAEKVAQLEIDVFVARQKLAPSHPEVRNKVKLLQELKERLDELINELGISFDDMMANKNNRANQERLAALRDALRQTNEREQQPPKVLANEYSELLENRRKPTSPEYPPTDKTARTKSVKLAHVFQLRHSSPEQVAESLNKILRFRAEHTADQTADAALIEVLPGKDALVVLASMTDIKIVEGLIAELDVAARSQEPKAPSDDVVKIYALQYVNGEHLAELLKSLPSNGPEVRISGDARTNRLIIQAGASDHKRIEKLISQLDVLGDVTSLEETAPKQELIKPKGFDELAKRVASAKILNEVGKAMLIYANDHDDKYPDSLTDLQEYAKDEELKWATENIGYLAKGKTAAEPPETVIAYDKTLLAKGQGTNVLFGDSHVSFEKPQTLKELGVGQVAIQIEARILSVSEDFLTDIGLDPNSIRDPNAWPEPAPCVVTDSDSLGTYSLLLDELNVTFLRKAAQAHEDAKVLTSPRVSVWDGEKAEIAIHTTFQYISGYSEPNQPGGEPVPKHDSVRHGTFLRVTPELRRDNKDNPYVYLDFESEIRQLRGVEERKYKKKKYPYQIPEVTVISRRISTPVPDGKTLLLGGQKMIRQARSKARVPILGQLPVLGRLFRRRGMVDEQRILLILVQPTALSPEQTEEAGLSRPRSPQELKAVPLGGYGGYGSGPPPGPGAPGYGGYGPIRPTEPEQK